MSVLELNVAISNIESIQGDLLSSVRHVPDAEKILKLSEFYRYSGCGDYLVSMESGCFCEGLYKSGKTYLDLLTLRETNIELDEYYLVRSRAEPILDAIAAGAFDLAKNIAKKLTMPLNERFEYSDDHYYFTFIAHLIEYETVGAEAEEIIQLFEGALGGIDSGRYEVAKALFEKDADAFNQALCDFADEWRGKIEKQRFGESISSYYNHTSANIFVEGIALIRLAKMLGMECAERFDGMPKELVNMSAVSFPEAFSIWG